VPVREPDVCEVSRKGAPDASFRACGCAGKIAFFSLLCHARALTVRQPYASLIFAAANQAKALDGSKNIENRSWPTSFRGDLVIHAGLRIDKQACKKFGLDPAELPRGVAIGRVTLADCVRNHSSKWAERGQWHRVLANPRLFSEAIPTRGRLGIFKLDLPPSH
jgi:ASCH domain